MNAARVLVVDDEPEICQKVCRFFYAVSSVKLSESPLDGEAKREPASLEAGPFARSA